jgi:hypothetical protein
LAERPQPVHIRVFVSSPGDVAEERALARDLLKSELPYDPLLRGSLTVEVASWEDLAAPTPMIATHTPQEAVNRFGLKPSDCDIVIVILWSRMGTRLDVSAFRKPDGQPYLSGTEWEFEDALNANPRPQILVYRRTDEPKVAVTDPTLRDKIEQFRAVNAFFARFRNNDGSFTAAYTAYSTPAEFKSRLSNDLRFIVGERLRAARVVAERGVPLAALRPVLERFGVGDEVPEKEVLERLAQLAEEYVNLRERFHWAPPTAEEPRTSPRKLRAFLCHGKEDKAKVLNVYRRLLDADVEPWMDEQSILPGKIWEDEIRHAIKDTDAMLVFLSRNSVSRTGYINKEIYQALEVTRLQPPGRIFIIPARLEQCEVPERLAEIQYVDYFEPNGYDRLLSALQELSNWLNQKGPVVRTVLRGIG